MAPAYKLSYFGIEGLAEPIRFLFKYGGIEFEDRRFGRDDWPTLKQSMPFGQVPVLEHNGKKVGQSISIARYVAKLVKLTGNNEWEDLEIDAIVDTINDLRLKVALYRFSEDGPQKEKQKATLFNETLPFYMERLDAVVKKNNGHLALGKLTWADLYLVGLSFGLKAMLGKDVFSSYPSLVQLEKTVLEIPNIKTWVQNKPKNLFEIN